MGIKDSKAFPNVEISPTDHYDTLAYQLQQSAFL
jgi:hypothetical protein